MPQPSLQDIAPILDPTGLVTLNASQIYQITSTAIPASAIGLNIETTDSALGVPIVPDANTNTKWKKYIWRRKSFNNTTKVYSKISDEGWLLADGSAVSRTVFATLFAGIGTLYGVGDGVNTFNLPDCRGRTLVGAGQGSGLTNRVLGTSFGEENHVLLTNELPKHTHALSTLGKASATGNIDDAGGGLVGQMATFPSTDLTAITGNDEGHSNFHPSIAVSIYIKT